MPVLANIEVIWVIIIIGSVIAQIIKGAKKVASQAPGKSTGAGEADTGGDRQREFVGSDDALQAFLQTLGGGEKPAAKATAASAVQAISARRGLSQARATVKKPSRPQAMREVRQQALPLPIPAVHQPKAGKVQDAVVLEKFTKRETSASILGEAIRKDLSNADAIRKAIVLREVLGPPVALR